MPIMIQKTSGSVESLGAAGHDNSSEQPLGSGGQSQDGIYKVEQIIASNAVIANQPTTGAKKLKRGEAKQARRTSKTHKTKDETSRPDHKEIVSEEVLTMVGDRQVDVSGLRLAEGKSRDRIVAQGETVPLESASFMEKVQTDLASSASEKNDEVAAEAGDLRKKDQRAEIDADQAATSVKGPKAGSLRTEEIHRQPIPIPKPDQTEQAAGLGSQLSSANDREPAQKLEAVVPQNLRVLQAQTRNDALPNDSMASARRSDVV